MIKLATRRASSVQAAVETGKDGWQAVWCFDLPGCCALVPPGGEPRAYARLAVLEFAAWSHERSAGSVAIEADAIAVAQVVDSGAHLEQGESRATFLFDAAAPAPAEFAHWANLHDRAVDELSAVVGGLSDGLLDATLAGGSPGVVVAAAVAYQKRLGQNLAASRVPVDRGSPADSLRESHRWLQGVVCDVPRDLNLRHDDEDWTVRKVMRRSVWHLRRSTWQLRAQLASLWLGGAI